MRNRVQLHNLPAPKTSADLLKEEQRRALAKCRWLETCWSEDRHPDNVEPFKEYSTLREAHDHLVMQGYKVVFNGRDGLNISGGKHSIHEVRANPRYATFARDEEVKAMFGDSTWKWLENRIYRDEPETFEYAVRQWWPSWEAAKASFAARGLTLELSETDKDFLHVLGSECASHLFDWDAGGEDLTGLRKDFPEAVEYEK